MPALKPPPPPTGAPTAGVPAQPTKTSMPKKFVRPVAEFRPPLIILNAVEGWGKTTFGAYAPDAGIIMARGEIGYLTLLGARRVPERPIVQIDNWQELLDLCDSLATDTGGLKTLVFDAMGGFERMCHEMVCDRDFGGDWSDRGFMSFHKGYEVSAGEWKQFTDRLERINATKILLSHCKVRTFKNPLGADFDRYASDVHDKTWSVTAKCSDAVLFGTFHTVVQGGKTGDRPQKGKGIGGSTRVIHTERRDAWDAKNRYGLPSTIDIPNDPKKAFETVWKEIMKCQQQPEGTAVGL